MFLAVLGLRCCTQAFSSCGKQGLFSSCGATPRLWSVRAPVGAVYGLSCLAARGVFPDQRSNLCPLHWQDSQPLDHRGSPKDLKKPAYRSHSWSQKLQHIPPDTCLSLSTFASPDRFGTRPVGGGVFLEICFLLIRRGGAQELLKVGAYSEK